MSQLWSQDHVMQRRLSKVLKKDDIIQYNNGMLALWITHGH